MKERIGLEDTIISAVMKLAEGNPGAVTVLMQAAKENHRIDPDCAFRELGPILSLDTHHIYGSNIWILFKDVCGQRIAAMLAVLRACQLGFHANPMTVQRNEVDALWDKVSERLPRFEKRIAEPQPAIV